MIDPGGAARPGILRNTFVRIFLFSLLVVAARFAYVVTTRGESCDIGQFCFFALPDNINFVSGVSNAASSAVTTNTNAPASAGKSGAGSAGKKRGWTKAVRFYASMFQDLISDGYLTPYSKALCVQTQTGEDVLALKEIGVSDSAGVAPLVAAGVLHHLPFPNNTFDFIFTGGEGLDRSSRQLDFAFQVSRTLKLKGFLVVHTISTDEYSFNSLLDLFDSCKLVRSRVIDGFDNTMPHIHQFVFQKISASSGSHGALFSAGSENMCAVPDYKQQLVRNAEPLIEKEPLKPWITLKRNIQNVKYLPTMADINFHHRYVYVDVGARSYGSSIGSWFRKQYPKQNKTFDIYAIEADKAFHEEYKLRKNVRLLPFAAWVKNESLFFEVNRDPGKELEVQERGMGRIQPVTSSISLSSDMDKIQGFDFANWLMNTVSERDFVVLKMDVEGTEFDLIPRLFETGAICLIDEFFLECHYNRWQKCCPGERSPKYEKTYQQCLDLFTSLRKSGVLVHQWW
uniref:DUF7870 domain-containing protein n=1 Tax=Kalanchoe fedtschenkoi TaxID=63787 RepID=A0A7N0T3K9_KALFE